MDMCAIEMRASNFLVVGVQCRSAQLQCRFFATANDPLAICHYYLVRRDNSFVSDQFLYECVFFFTRILKIIKIWMAFRVLLILKWHRDIYST